MKRLFHLVVCLGLALGALSAHAQRAFNQAELDSLLAPIALYPDPLLADVLNASVFPHDVASAAAWSRANPHLQGDDAIRAVERELWHPSVKVLVAHPDVLARMAESPQWLSDLGEAYSGSPAYVNQTVQQLRMRAQAGGHLRSDEHQHVYQHGDAIAVQPVYPHIVYARYYDPYVVYGGWWWPAYRPFFWRPWIARPVIVHRHVHRPVHVHRHVHRPAHGHRPAHVHRPAEVHRPVPVHRVRPSVHVTPHRVVPESRRQPIIQSAPAVRSATTPQWRAVERHERGSQRQGHGNSNRGGNRHRS